MRKYLVLCVLTLLTLPSCLTIVQSLVTHDNIITDNRMYGLWIGPGTKSILVQKLMNSKLKNLFIEAEYKGYTSEDSVFYTKLSVISFRENNLEYTWLAGLVKIKDHYYLNLKPEECLSTNGKEAYRLNGRDFLITSSIAKLEWKNNNTLLLTFLNGNFIKEIILNGKARINHEYDPLFDTFVITASSQELQQFLEKYGNNESLFKGGNTITITLTRKT
ncbi:MAG TPA: hypothetical protein VMY77_05685 [Chitinophagaceae bacterium]|nr:hypothetical protein [Chitinophagaceae bacterium]